jgi:hypothetical protein
MNLIKILKYILLMCERNYLGFFKIIELAKSKIIKSNITKTKSNIEKYVIITLLIKILFYLLQTSKYILK